MPNWVSNILTINGNNYELDKFYNENKNYDNEEKEELDFYKSIPMPDDIFRGNLGQQERELYGNKNWYDWNCANFGTKWNVNGAHVDSKEFIDNDSVNNIMLVINRKTNKNLNILRSKFIELFKKKNSYIILIQHGHHLVIG